MKIHKTASIAAVVVDSTHSAMPIVWAICSHTEYNPPVRWDTIPGCHLRPTIPRRSHRACAHIHARILATPPRPRWQPTLPRSCALSSVAYHTTLLIPTLLATPAHNCRPTHNTRTSLMLILILSRATRHIQLHHAPRVLRSQRVGCRVPHKYG